MLKFTANLSLLFTELPLIERFKAAKQAGFDAVEIQFPYELNAARIKEQLDAHALKLVLFNVDAADLLQGGEGLASVPEKQQQFRQAIGQTADYAKTLKPESINVLPGRCSNPGRLAEYMATFKSNLRFAVETFEPMGINTVFEAINSVDMPGFIINTSSQMLELLRQLSLPKLMMQYDIYHMRKMGEDPEPFLAEYADKIGHIQFADCPGRGQPGTGTIDFNRLFTTIAQSNYSGWIGAEYKPTGSTNDSLTWLKQYQSLL